MFGNDSISKHCTPKLEFKSNHSSLIHFALSNIHKGHLSGKITLVQHLCLLELTTWQFPSIDLYFSL